MTDELSITISAGIAPSWHTRVVHDNFDDAFKTLDGLVDRRPTKINVLTWLGKIGNKYSESASTDNISDAITALGQHDAAVERITKPAHPFKVGDRVFFGGAKGVVDGLVDDTRIKVRWDDTTHGSLVLVERLRMEAAENPFERQLKVGDRVAWIDSGLKGLKGTVTAEGSGKTVKVRWDSDTKDFTENTATLRKVENVRTFKPGDRVRWHSEVAGKSTGTVVEPNNGTTVSNPVRVKWDRDSIGTANENATYLRLERAVEDKPSFKVGDQVGWIHESGANTLVGIVTKRTDHGHTWVQWSTDSNSMKEKVENLRKIESLPYKVGDRVRYAPSASYSSNPGIGIVHKVFTPSAAAGITNYRYGINWSKGGVTTENGDHLKLEQIVETVIEPGDRVRLENGGRATVLKPGKGVYPDERRVIYDIGGAIRVHAANNLTKTED